jgi:hypothetical protein
VELASLCEPAAQAALAVAGAVLTGFGSAFSRA